MNAARPANAELSAILSLLFSMFLWGFIATGIKLLLPHFTLTALNGWRLIVASGLFLLALWLSRAWPKLSAAEYRRIALVSFLGTTAFQYTFVNGIAHSPAGISSLVGAVNPVWVAIIGMALGERLSAKRWLGIGLSALGIVLMGLKSLDASSGVTLVGLAWLLSSNIVWALYTVFQRPFFKTITPLQFNGVGYALGSIPYVLLGLPQMVQATQQAVPVGAWLGVIAVALFGQVIGFAGWSRGVQVIGATRAAVFLNLVPLVGLTVAHFILGEPITLLTLLAAAVTLAGVSLANSR